MPPALTLSSFLASVGSIGLFASRAFVTAFSVAALLKWGPEVGWINDWGLLEKIEDVPAWFTHDITVTILGVLAVLEIAATKSSDARAALNEVDRFLKSSMAFVTMLSTHEIITQADAELIRQMSATLEPLQLGLGDVGTGVGLAIMSAVGVWYASSARGAVMGMMIEADPEDDTMVASLFSWAEDLWAIFGAVLLVFFPFIMLGITVVLLGVLAMARLWVKRKDARAKEPCADCGEQMYRSAMACPSCKTPNANVHGVDWLGRTLTTPTHHQESHPYVLMQKQRCPVCATYLKERKIHQACETCGHEVFASEAEVDRYIGELDSKVPGVLVMTAVFSFIPIIGLIPAVMIYRVQLVTPLRRYISMFSSLPARWILRVMIVLLCWLQLIPLVGVLAVPVMAVMSFSVYRGLFKRQWKKEG